MTPNSLLSCRILPASGMAVPDSQRETACRDRFSFSASSSWESHADFRCITIFSDKFMGDLLHFVHILCFYCTKCAQRRPPCLLYISATSVYMAGLPSIDSRNPEKGCRKSHRQHHLRKLMLSSLRISLNLSLAKHISLLYGNIAAPCLNV